MQYTQELSVPRRNRDKKGIDDFRNKLFKDCADFIKKERGIAQLPLIVTVFKSQQEYTLLETKKSRSAVQKEKPRNPNDESCAFAVVGKQQCTIVLNCTYLGILFEKSPESFVYGFTDSLIHEILHCHFDDSKNEQEIHDLTNSMVESFLGIKLPTEIKQFKALDKYTEQP